MEPPHFISRLLGGLTEAAMGLVRRAKPPAMIGLPPSARGLTGRPLDIAEHARAMACEWDDVGEAYVQNKKRELVIADNRIGAPDYERGFSSRIRPATPRG
jgi:hypothetical protein